MSKNKRICLLGFSQEIENNIKQIINTNTQINIDWVAANDKYLDGVVINAGFLEAPQIQKYMRMIKASMVCAHNNNSGQEMANAHRLHSINPKENNINLSRWIEKLLGENSSSPKDLSFSSTGSQTESNSALAHNPQPRKEGEMDNDGKILQRIRNRENVVLCAVNDKNTTWVKPAEGLVYIDYAREKIPAYDLWQWSEVSANTIPAFARQLKIDLWLFETIWQSEIDATKYINTNAHYKLSRWPQPLNREGRTEALRLAATAQSYPVNPQTLKDKTGYQLDHIHRFIFATIIAGQISEVKGEIKQIKPSLTPMDEKKREEKRGLLQRFRAKLGL